MADINPAGGKEKFEPSNSELEKVDGSVEKEISPEIKELIKPAVKVKEGALKKSSPQDQPKKGVIAPVNESEIKAIENILADDLEEIYQKLPAAKQAEFKTKGEEVASRISLLINQVKYKVSEILELIKNWLKIIPGVSKFFLEQEAKIKTDKIIKYHQNKK